MVKEILSYLPYLGAAIVTNILLGMYNSLEKLKDDFSWRKLLLGVAKAGIISEAFIALALIFDKLSAGMDMGIFEVAPDVLLLAVIALYVGKSIENLKNIFGVTAEQIEEINTALPPYSAPPDVVEHHLDEQNGEG